MMDFYAVLGIGKNAPPEEVRQAFKRMAAKWHPDRAGGDTEKFQQVQEAWAVLGDEQKRDEYDAGLMDDEPETNEEMAAVEAINQAINKVVSHHFFESLSIKDEVISLLSQSIQSRIQMRERDLELVSRLRKIAGRINSKLYRGAINRKIAPLTKSIEEQDYFIPVLEAALVLVEEMEEIEIGDGGGDSKAIGNSRWLLDGGV